jgi:hypothetical protein
MVVARKLCLALLNRFGQWVRRLIMPVLNDIQVAQTDDRSATQCFTFDSCSLNFQSSLGAETNYNRRCGNPQGQSDFSSR